MLENKKAFTPSLEKARKESAGLTMHSMINKLSRELHICYQKTLDKVLREAIEKYLGREFADDELKGRCEKLVFSDKPDVSTYCVDNIPVLKWCTPRFMGNEGIEYKYEVLV